MKLLSTQQQNQISGGTIMTVHGKKLNVNTAGIPQVCVKTTESFLQSLVLEMDVPNPSNANGMRMMGEYMDRMDLLGCDILAINQRIQTAIDAALRA